MEEVRGWNLAQSAAFPTTLKGLEDAVRPVLNADMPNRVGEMVSIADLRLFKTGTEQYRILALVGNGRARALQAAVVPSITAVIPLSCSRTCIAIEGATARDPGDGGCAGYPSRGLWSRSVRAHRFTPRAGLDPSGQR